MKQYHNLLEDILTYGSLKPAAREGMPGTLSLFGYQQRYNLADGFPILTTKRVSFKNIVVELLWFLRGSTNIKFLVDHNVNIWNQDAYNYYTNKCLYHNLHKMSFDTFIQAIKDGAEMNKLHSLHGGYAPGYELGDCGYQYGKVWRDWDGGVYNTPEGGRREVQIDQLENVISDIKNNPFGRRKLVTAVDPAHDADLALYWCHALFQFNCRQIDMDTRLQMLIGTGHEIVGSKDAEFKHKILDEYVPRYYLDCQMYQRSADVFLGVPYNISSYCLLTHIVAKVCNMIPGQFVHTFGDVHIYDNHMDQVKELLGRDPGLHKLPKLVFGDYLNDSWKNIADDLSLLANIEPHEIMLDGYESYPGIKAELSTGMKK